MVNIATILAYWYNKVEGVIIKVFNNLIITVSYKVVKLYIKVVGKKGTFNNIYIVINVKVKYLIILVYLLYLLSLSYYKVLLNNVNILLYIPSYLLYIFIS